MSYLEPCGSLKSLIFSFNPWDRRTSATLSRRVEMVARKPHCNPLVQLLKDEKALLPPECYYRPRNGHTARVLFSSVISLCHISHIVLGYSKLERCSQSPGERIMTSLYICSTLDREDVQIYIKLHSDIFIQTPLCQISCVVSHILKINSMS